MGTVFRRATADDYDRCFALAAQAFNAPVADKERLRAEFKPERVRVAEVDGKLLAKVVRLDFAQHFGGRAVSSTGVSGVAVAAEARGQGIGSALMREFLKELRSDGLAISSLYPATVPIYRSCGYGYGFLRTAWKANLRALPSAAVLAVEAFDDDVMDEVRACYERYAATQNGLVQRPDAWWTERVLSTRDDTPQYRYLVREAGEVTGYMLYTIGKLDRSWRSRMNCRDLVWTTKASGVSLLALGALHRSTLEDMVWVGPPVEPLVELLPEEVFASDECYRAMLRLLDVPKAFEARGYPPGVEAAVTIEVRDPLFPENAGTWRLDVSGGTAKCTPDAAKPQASADVTAWATIWSSLHPARTLVRQGALEASESAVAALEQMFAGPTPWLADFF